MVEAFMSALLTDTVSTAPEPALLTRLRSHFDGDAASLPIVEQDIPIYDRANLHLTVNEMLSQAGRQTELIGVLVLEHYQEARLAQLTRAASAKNFEVGPVNYVDVALAEGGQLACVKRGLYLFRYDDRPIAMLLQESGNSYRPM